MAHQAQCPYCRSHTSSELAPAFYYADLCANCRNVLRNPRLDWHRAERLIEIKRERRKLRLAWFAGAELISSATAIVIVIAHT